MTVSSTSSDTRYSGNGSTTAFATGFTFYASSTLRVSLIQVSTGVETVQTLTTHYTVSGGNGSTGTVTMLTAPASGYTLVIKRDEPYTQLTDLLDNDPLPAPVLEGTYDKLVMQIQQVYRRTLTAIQAPATFNPNTDTPYTMSAPTNGTVPVGNGTGWDATALASINPAAIPVSITSLANRDMLEYDSASTAWKNQTLSTVLKRIATTAGDLLYNLSGTISRLAIGTAGQVLTVSGGAPAWVTPQMPTMYIYGLTYANNGSDATNDIDIAAGGCMDDTGAFWIQIAATTKQSDVAWAADNGATPSGMLDTGAVGNNDYDLYAIKNPMSGATGVLCTISGSTPTMPSGYTLKRKFGWFKRSGGTIVAFKTYELAGGGLEYIWTAPTLDVNLANTLTTSGRTDAIRVPLNFSVVSHINVQVFDASTNFKVWIYNPDHTSAAPSGSAAPLANITPPPGTSLHEVQLRIRTSATGTIGARADLATVDEYRVSTLGFEWSRR